MNTQLMPAQQNYSYQHLENTTNAFERVCRTCLSEQAELRPLLSDRLTEMLMSFTTVQVTANDGLPSNICTQCVLHISRAFNFKQQAEQSDATLRQFIYQSAQDPLTANILEANYNANNTTVQENIVKQGYFAGNLEQNNQIKSQVPDKLPDSEIKLEDTEKESEENCEETCQSENDDSEDDSSEDDSKHCDICSLTFIDQNEYDKHMKKHSKTKNHVCSECGKSYQYKVGLKTHMRTHGVGEKKHKCKHCGKRFYELNDCVIHERKHTGEKPEVCETCGKRFADPRSLAKHLKIHTGEKNYQCDVCNKKFIHSYTLTAHKRVHTGEKPFICNICAHACATSTQLTLHMRTHTKEKPYSCPLCSKTFTSKSGLTTHQVTHTGERKYICLICGKGSRTSTDLNSHMRTHTGEKPYECKVPQCEKKYKTSSQLNAHMRTHTDDLSEEEVEDVPIKSDSSIFSTKAESILSDSDFKAHFRLSKTTVQTKLIKQHEPSSSQNLQDLVEPGDKININEPTTEDYEAANTLLLLLDSPEVTKRDFGCQVNTTGIKLDSINVSVGCQVNTSRINTVCDFIETDKQLNSLTGIHSFQLLNAIVKLAEEEIKDRRIHRLTVKHRIILTFIKMKTDATYVVLSLLFGHITSQTCKSIFHKTLPILANIFKSVIHLSSREEINRNIPLAFDHFRNVRLVLDCTEILVQRPKCLCCRITTYSHYKGNFTVKFMTAVTPGGLISFISKVYGGRTSDKAIFEQSDLIKSLDMFHDALLIDKGFQIDDICLSYGIRIIRPPFLKNKKQLSAEEAILNAKIAKARVHIERTYQRVKIFKIFKYRVHWNLVPQMENIFVIACGVANLSAPILSDDKFF